MINCYLKSKKMEFEVSAESVDLRYSPRNRNVTSVSITYQGNQAVYAEMQARFFVIV